MFLNSRSNSQFVDQAKRKKGGCCVLAVLESYLRRLHQLFINVQLITRSAFFWNMASLYHFPMFRENEVVSTWARAPGERHPELHLRKPNQIFRFLFLLYYQSRSLLNRNARGLYSGGTRFELGCLVCWPRFLTVFLFLPVTYEKQYLIDLRYTNF